MLLPPTLASSACAVPFTHRSVSAPSAFLAPSEGWLVVHTAALVIFSSWAFGSVEDWAQTWLLALTLLALPLLAVRFRETRAFSIGPLVPPLVWLAFVIVALLNPSHAPSPAGGWILRTGWIPWLPTTVDPSRTLADARVWFAALSEGAVLVAVLRTAAAARRVWTVIALNGFALAATGAFFHFAGAERVLGIVEPPEPTYFFATFFYKNHWAAYAALAAVAALTLALRASAAAFAGDPAARGRTWLLGSAGLLITTTLPLPGSRTGALLAAIIVVGFFAALFRQWRNRPGGRPLRRGPAVAIFTLIGIGIVAFGAVAYAPRATADLQRSQLQLQRHVDGEALDLRVLLSRDTWRMAQQRPWFGWGPGCFEIVFPVFQGDYLRGPDQRSLARPEFAHNDWLQLLAETGFVGAALLLIPLALLVRRAWRHTDWVGRRGLAGCGLVALQAWIDFPFHNPAVLLLWVVMLATAPCLGVRSDHGV